MYGKDVIIQFIELIKCTCSIAAQRWPRQPGGTLFFALCQTMMRAYGSRRFMCAHRKGERERDCIAMIRFLSVFSAQVCCLFLDSARECRARASLTIAAQLVLWVSECASVCVCVALALAGAIIYLFGFCSLTEPILRKLYTNTATISWTNNTTGVPVCISQLNAMAKRAGMFALRVCVCAFVLNGGRFNWNILCIVFYCIVKPFIIIYLVESAQARACSRYVFLPFCCVNAIDFVVAVVFVVVVRRHHRHGRLSSREMQLNSLHADPPPVNVAKLLRKGHVIFSHGM